MIDLNVEQLTILYRLVSLELDNNQSGFLPNCLTDYHNHLSFLLSEIHACIRRKMSEITDEIIRDSKCDNCNSALRDCSLCGSGDDA